VRYLVGHLDDAPGQPWQETDPAEEIYVIPYGARVATAVPVGALRHLLPILHEAAAELPPATCACCGEALPAPTPADGA
jgi:hypothetical protein